MNSAGDMTMVGALGSSLLDFSCYHAASQGRKAGGNLIVVHSYGSLLYDFRSAFRGGPSEMSRPQSWGDELTLCASAHLLPRPILVLSDQEHEHERRFEPPPLIHSSVWGPEVYVVHLNNNHYEATCPLAKPSTKKEIVKREPSNL